MGDKEVKELTEEIQKLKRQLEVYEKAQDRLRREKKWLIEDFAKSLQFHSKVRTTLEFQQGIIRQELANAVRE